MGFNMKKIPKSGIDVFLERYEEGQILYTAMYDECMAGMETLLLRLHAERVDHQYNVEIAIIAENVVNYKFSHGLRVNDRLLEHALRIKRTTVDFQFFTTEGRPKFRRHLGYQGYGYWDEKYLAELLFFYCLTLTAADAVAITDQRLINQTIITQNKFTRRELYKKAWGIT